MRAYVVRVANDLRERYWFIPTVMAVAALLLAAAMIWIDSHHRVAWLEAARAEALPQASRDPALTPVNTLLDRLAAPR